MTIDAVQTQDGQATLGGGPMAQLIGRRWMVSAGHALAAQGAAHILGGGGNAIDAGVAAGFMLGVVHPDMVSFAGVAPILVHLARTGETIQVSGVGPYPRRASADFYRAQCGGQIPVGLLRTVVPASPASWCEALARWGTVSFAEAVAPALECAEQGFPLSVFTAYQIRSNAARLRQWPTSAPLYFPGGQPAPAGHLFVQSELGEAIRLMIAAEAKASGRGRAAGIRAARDAFYKGEIARRIADYHAREGGLLTAEDLAEFEVEVGPALTTSYRDYQIAACGFWCQGPVLLQMFNLIEGYDVGALGHNSPRYAHVLAECMKLAFADREAYYGDPNHVKVPADGLLSKVYAEARRALVREDRAWPDMPPPGDPTGLGKFRNGHAGRAHDGGPSNGLDTSYVAVIDAEGNGFSATPSDPCVDSPVVPGVGCVVSPRGSQGWLTPGHPSEVGPGKRPRLTPAPAMALHGGRLFMAFGTPGGDVQQQAMLQVFMNVVEFGMRPQPAVEAPRFATRSFPDSFWPHGSAPGRLDMEQRIPAGTRTALAALGHTVNDWPDWDWRAGAVCAVVAGPDGMLMAGADPRRGAHAIGW
ncbi:MAG TPA: gamma-glutamyltransferase [Candidatus Binatia bacterium]|nr:gamma-glutamyltransferase [Candidatus Binatia bacterium]